MQDLKRHEPAGNACCYVEIKKEDGNEEIYNGISCDRSNSSGD